MTSILEIVTHYIQTRGTIKFAKGNQVIQISIGLSEPCLVIHKNTENKNFPLLDWNLEA